MEKEYIKSIDDFVKSANENMLFGNGLSTTIEKPINDQDALIKGFKKTHIDEEHKGGWKLLAAKDVEIHEINYRAVLYEYKKKQHIVLYKPQKENEYYFRIY